MKRPLAWSSLALLALTVVATAFGLPDPRVIPHDQLRKRAQLEPASRSLSATDAGPASSAAAAMDSGPTSRPNSGKGGRGNAFVNDPCLDPPPQAPFPVNYLRTVQSSTEIAVLNSILEADDDIDDDEWNDSNGHGHDSDGNHSDKDKSGMLMVAAYNDSYGQEDNRQGMTGFSYSTDGGRQWIDAGGLPPVVASGAPAGTPGSDTYFGDPSIVVHHRTKKFYVASLYQSPITSHTPPFTRPEEESATPDTLSALVKRHGSLRR